MGKRGEDLEGLREGEEYNKNIFEVTKIKFKTRQAEFWQK